MLSRLQDTVGVEVSIVFQSFSSFSVIRRSTVFLLRCFGKHILGVGPAMFRNVTATVVAPVGRGNVSCSTFNGLVS